MTIRSGHSEAANRQKRENRDEYAPEAQMMLCGIRILEHARKRTGLDAGGIECGGRHEDRW